MERLMRVAGVECVEITNCSFLEVSVLNNDQGHCTFLHFLRHRSTTIALNRILCPAIILATAQVFPMYSSPFVNVSTFVLAFLFLFPWGLHFMALLLVFSLSFLKTPWLGGGGIPYAICKDGGAFQTLGVKKRYLLVCAAPKGPQQDLSWYLLGYNWGLKTKWPEIFDNQPNK